MMKIIEILDYLDDENFKYIYIGDKNLEVTGFSSLRNYKNQTFTWIKNQKSLEMDISNIHLAFVQSGVNVDLLNSIICDESKKCFFKVIEHFFTARDILEIKSYNTISSEAAISEGVSIGFNTVIDGKVVIGSGTKIGNNVTILDNVIIGENCIIDSGVVIGHDGFGWLENEDGSKKMISHFGGVRIGNDVLISSNTVIARGTLDDTIVESGVKIDALCFIAHNVIIKENSILITGTKLYGSSIIGKGCYIASAIIRNQCTVGDNSTVGMGTVVTKNIPANVIVLGNPARIISINKEGKHDK